MKVDKKTCFVSEKDKKRMLALWGTGLSSVKIGKELGVHGSTIRYHLKKHGIETSRGFGPGKVYEEKKVLIRKMWGEGKSAYRIAKDLRLDDVTILKHLRKMGFNTSIRYHGRVSEEKKDKIQKLWNDGLKCKDISALLKMSRKTVSKYLKERGIERIYKPKKFTEETEKMAIKMYKSGMGGVTIANKLGMSPSGVISYLRGRGIVIRKRSKQYVNSDTVSEMIYLWRNGFSGQYISKEMGMPTSTVYLHLRKHVDTTRGGKYCRKVTDEMKTIMKYMWKGGKSCNDISQRFKLSKGGVMGCLKRMGIDTSEHANKKIGDEDKNKILDLWKHGLNIKQIAGKMGFSNGTVSKYLNQMGYQSHQIPGKVNWKTRNDIIRYWKLGESSRKIADRLNLAKSTILFQLKKSGMDTGRCYNLDFEIIKEKYYLLQKIIIFIFKKQGYDIFRIRDFSDAGADFLLRKNGILIPVEFKAEMVYGHNIKEGLKQISNYIRKNTSPYGYFVSTANKKDSITIPKNVRVLWGDDLYNLYGNKDDLDFIRYTPVKTIKENKIKKLTDFINR